MLRDSRIRELNDFLVTSDVFPGVELRGGVCFFLWDKNYIGDCRVVTHIAARPPSEATRPLLESGATVFLRFNEAVSIVRKVVAFETKDSSLSPLSGKAGFARFVSSRKPFGFDTTMKGGSEMKPNYLVLFQNGGTSFIARQSVQNGHELIDTWKVFISMAYGAGSDPVPSRVLGKGFVGEPGTVCTETYLCIGPFASKLESENVVKYLLTKFARFLILMNKPSQHATKKVYSYLPSQDWSRRLTDVDLYLKYGLTDDEIAHIESMIRPMDAADE
jgi:site-specific DNA-methyltransferase (adenine-specific)